MQLKLVAVLFAIAYYSIVNDSFAGYVILTCLCLLLLFFGVEWTPPNENESMVHLSTKKEN